jgi:hypothetical protein
MNKKINQKFVWLKIASVNISCSNVHDGDDERKMAMKGKLF